MLKPAIVLANDYYRTSNAKPAHGLIRGSERWVHWDPTREGTSGVLEIHGPKPQWNAMEETFTIPPDDKPGYGGRLGVSLVRDWLDAAKQGAVYGADCKRLGQ